MASEEEANHRIVDYKLQCTQDYQKKTWEIKRVSYEAGDQKILTLGAYLIFAVCLYMNVYTCSVYDTVLSYVYDTRVYTVEIEL